MIPLDKVAPEPLHSSRTVRDLANRRTAASLLKKTRKVGLASKECGFSGVSTCFNIVNLQVTTTVVLFDSEFCQFCRPFDLCFCFASHVAPPAWLWPIHMAVTCGNCSES
jgi:hypothetical protein